MDGKLTIQLTLTTQEAAWLKALVQNPICYSLANEPEEDRKMRETFWKQLGADL